MPIVRLLKSFNMIFVSIYCINRLFVLKYSKNLFARSTYLCEKNLNEAAWNAGTSFARGDSIMEIKDYLRNAVELCASDVFLKDGGPVRCKVNGEIRIINEKVLSSQEIMGLVSGLYALAGRDMGHYTRTGDDDFSFSISGLAHFRINTYRHGGYGGGCQDHVFGNPRLENP